MDPEAQDASPDSGNPVEGASLEATALEGMVVSALLGAEQADSFPSTSADSGAVGNHALSSVQPGQASEPTDAFSPSWVDERLAKSETESSDIPPPDEPSDTDAEPEDSSSLRGLIEWIVVLGSAVAVALLLRAFVFQAFWIPSESMETTLVEGDRILVNKTSYRLHDVNRGDVVVFRRPDDQPGEIRDLIKRVIALEGESIEGRDGEIYINGQLLFEPYLGDDPLGDFGPTTVSEGEVFVMGDNRDESFDSRRFGPIDTDRIVGRAFVTFWPFNRLGSL